MAARKDGTKAAILAVRLAYATAVMMVSGKDDEMADLKVAAMA